VISPDLEPQPESNLVHFGLKIWHLVYDYSRRFRRKRFLPENGDYSRQCGRGLSKPTTAASEKVEVVAI